MWKKEAIKKTKSEKFKNLDLTKTDYDRNQYKDILRYISGLTFEEIEEKSIFHYIYYRLKFFKMNSEVTGYRFYTFDDLAVEHYQTIYRPQYRQFPEEESINRWLKDRWEDPLQYSIFCLDFKNNILEIYKEKFNYKGDYKVYEIKEHSNFFPEAYKIFVCEELRILHVIEAYELKTTKGISSTLYCDFENSPFFDESQMTKDEKKRVKYQEDLQKKAKRVGYEEMNQEALLAYVDKKKENAKKLEDDFKYNVYKWGNGQIWDTIDQYPDKQLNEILKTYTIMANPYLYKRFTEWHLLNWCELGYSADFEDKRNVYGCKLSKLEERKQKLSLSEYLGLTEDDEWVIDTTIADKMFKKNKRNGGKK